jgi:hypothetical protein
MPGPGEYLADVTEGITRVEDLPKAQVLIRSRNYLVSADLLSQGIFL